MERKTSSVKRHYCFGEDTIFCPGHPCALFRACSQPKNLNGWRWEEGRECASLCSLLPGGCSACYKAGTCVFAATLCPKGVNCKQARGCRRAVWRQPWPCAAVELSRAGCQVFPSPCTELWLPGQSTDMVSWNPNFPTWCPHQQGLQRSDNTYWELPSRTHICISYVQKHIPRPACKLHEYTHIFFSACT